MKKDNNILKKIGIVGISTSILVGSAMIGLAASGIFSKEKDEILIHTPNETISINENNFKEDEIVDFTNTFSTSTEDTTTSGVASDNELRAQSLEKIFYETAFATIYEIDSEKDGSYDWAKEFSIGNAIKDEKGKTLWVVPGTEALNSLEDIYSSMVISTLYSNTMMSSKTLTSYIYDNSANNPDLITACLAESPSSAKPGGNGTSNPERLIENLNSIYDLTDDGQYKKTPSEIINVWNKSLIETDPTQGGCLYQLTSSDTFELDLYETIYEFSFLYQSSYDSVYENYLAAYMYTSQPMLVWQIEYKEKEDAEDNLPSPTKQFKDGEWNKSYDTSTSTGNPETVTKHFISPTYNNGNKVGDSNNLSDYYMKGFIGIQFAGSTFPNITNDSYNNKAKKYESVWNYDRVQSQTDPDLEGKVWVAGDSFFPSSEGAVPVLFGYDYNTNGTTGALQDSESNSNWYYTAGIPIYPKKVGLGNYDSGDNRFDKYGYVTNWQDGEITAGSFSPIQDVSDIGSLWEAVGLQNDIYGQMYIINSIIDNVPSINSSSYNFWNRNGFYIELKGDFTELEQFINPQLLKKEDN